MISEQQAIRGAEKAAIVMLAAGEAHSVNLFTQLADAEIKEISDAMARLENLNATVVENVLDEFASHAPVMLEKPATAKPKQGSLGSAESRSYGGQYEGGSKVADKTPTQSVWSDLDRIDPNSLANYLENEHPQTAAVVLTRLDRTQAATVLSKFDEAFTAEVVDRMLSADGVKDEILASVEQTLRREFVDQSVMDDCGHDTLNTVMELLGKLDPAKEQKFLETLALRNQDAVKRIRGQRFAFEDLEALTADDLSRVASKVTPSQLALALKGASDTLRDRVLAAFPVRVARSLEAEMASSGPVRLRDVDAAQAKIADAARTILGRHNAPTEVLA